MGFNPFKSKKVTTVGTSVVRLIKDKDLVDSTKAALATALFSNTDIVDEVLEANINGLAVRTERMYQYAKRNSPYGLPTGEVYSNTQGKEQLQAVLDELEGSPVFIEYHRFGSPNGIHMGWMNLLEYHGYDPQTNKLMNLSIQKNTDVYLENMVLEMPASMAADHDREEVAIWGKSPNAGYTPGRALMTGNDYAEVYYNATPAVFTEGVLVPQLKVTYTWQEKAEVYKDGSYGRTKSYEISNKYGTFSMPYRDVDLDSGYFHVKYVVNGVTKYWMYQYGAGTYPELDAVFVDSPNVIGDYFPNIYFRLAKKNLSKNKETDTYKVQKKLTKYLGASFDDIAEAIHANEDIADVEQAFLTMGVPADSEDPIDQRYLYEYFDQLYSATDTDVKDSSDNFNWKVYAKSFLSVLKNKPIIPVSQTITIKDKAFKMDLSNSGILKTRIIGKVGEVGEIVCGKAEWTYKTTVNSEYGGVSNTREVTQVIPYRYYRKQISEHFYDEIQVVNAQMKYWIFNGHHTILGDDNKEVLLIPIDRAILKTFNARDSEKLISRSLHFVFNSRVVTKVKWYQQEWFGIFMLVVAIVITVVSFGSDGGSSIQAAVAALAGMTAQQILIWIAMKVLVFIAVREVFKLFVKAVGVEIAYIAALIAMAYGIKLGIEGNSGSFAGFEVTAQTMMQTVSGIVQGINMELRSLYTDLLGESNTFNLFKKEKMDLLEEAKDLLKSDGVLLPYTVWGESPDSYFKRTIHSGNIGTYLIDDVHNYVSRNLQLPDFSTSIGGVTYGY